MNTLLLILILPLVSSAEPPERVYRAAMETPEQVEQAGGFYPRGMDGSRPNQPPPNINLWDHTHGAATGLSRYDSGYVATTSSLGFARGWVNDHLNHNGYVYYIRATPNFIDVNGSLRQYSPHPEELEFAALGIIHWGQIIGWERVRGGSVGPFIANRDYRGNIYDDFHSSGPQPQLAGFPAGNPAWAQEPWLTYADCGVGKYKISTCNPIRSSQQEGETVLKKIKYEISTKLFQEWYAVSENTPPKNWHNKFIM